MKREFSAGGIVFNTEGEVLLINNAAMKDPTKSYWGFPKGHLDNGETAKEAALREVKEETGLVVEIIDKVGDHKYVFTVDGERIFKVVTLYLMKELNGKLKFQEDELLDAKWVDSQDALSKLSFSSDKKLFQKALEMLDGK